MLFEGGFEGGYGVEEGGHEVAGFEVLGEFFGEGFPVIFAAALVDGFVADDGEFVGFRGEIEEDGGAVLVEAAEAEFLEALPGGGEGVGDGAVGDVNVDAAVRVALGVGEGGDEAILVDLGVEGLGKHGEIMKYEL
jgi:hypothetical protein